MFATLTYLKRFALALSFALSLAACSGIVSVDDTTAEVPQSENGSRNTSSHFGD